MTKLGDGKKWYGTKKEKKKKEKKKERKVKDDVQRCMLNINRDELLERFRSASHTSCYLQPMHGVDPATPTHFSPAPSHGSVGEGHGQIFLLGLHHVVGGVGNLVLGRGQAVLWHPGRHIVQVGRGSLIAIGSCHPEPI